MIDAKTICGLGGSPLRRPSGAVLLLIAALLVTPLAQAERDVGSQAACLNKYLRKLNGAEGGRASALQGHFGCFPEDARNFALLFEGAGPLAGNPSPHFELFFAARPSVSEREWSAKAIGVLAGGQWSSGAIARFALLLRINIKSRPTGPLDAAARLSDPLLDSFWHVLFGSAEGFYPDHSVCKGRPENRACEALAAIR